MDFKHFKKVAVDHEYTTLEHPDGHIIKVKHKKLPHTIRQELRHVPIKEKHFARGGEVPMEKRFPNGTDEEKKGPNLNPDKVKQFEQGFNGVTATPIPQPTQQYADGGDVAGKVGKYLHDKVSQSVEDTGQAFGRIAAPVMDFGKALFTGNTDTQPMQAQAMMDQGSPQPASQDTGPTNYPLQQQPQQPQTNTDIWGTDATLQNYEKGLKQEIGGINAGAKAQGALGQAEANHYDNAARSQAALTSHHQQEANDNGNEYHQLFNAINNKEIDPDHYWHSMSTPGKISTAIGMLLGGLGSMGGENQVTKFINQQIDRDIDAQKADLGKKMNLLNAIHQHMGDERDATDMLSALLKGTTGYKIAQEAANAQNPIAKAAALKESGALLKEASDKLGLLNARRAVTKGLVSGQVPPEMAIPVIVPKEHQQKAIDAAGKVAEVEAFRKDLHDTNNQLRGMTLNGAFSPNKRSALIDLLAGKLSHTTAGRFNMDEARKQIGSVLYSPTDFSDTMSTKDRGIDRLSDTLRAEHDKQLSTWGLKMPKAPTAHRRVNAPSDYGKK